MSWTCTHRSVRLRLFVPDDLRLAPVAFADPCGLGDVRLLAEALTRGGLRLQREQEIAEWMLRLRAAGLVRSAAALDDRGTSRAAHLTREYLTANAEGTPPLDEVVAATGANKFMMLRAFRRN